MPIIEIVPPELPVRCWTYEPFKEKIHTKCYRIWRSLGAALIQGYKLV